MNSYFPKLFQRGKIGRMEIKNRIVKAATGTYLVNPDGSVSGRQLKYYEELAKNNVGMIFTDNALVVDEYHMGTYTFSDKHIPSLSTLAAAISDQGARAAMQIGHPGRDSVFVGGATAKAASRMQWEPWYQAGFPIPEAMTIEEIHQVVDGFGDSANRLKIAGFDMVEILAGHGCLINNFLSPGQNVRNDMYGGSFDNRIRILVEIVCNIRKKVGEDYPLCARMSMEDYEPNGLGLEESLKICKILEQLGVDVINVTGGTHGEAVHAACSMLVPRAPYAEAARALQKAVDIPIILCNSITTPDLAESLLEDGTADFIALARPLFADPEWAKKAKEGRSEDIRPCIRCNDGCHDRGMLAKKFVRCTVNASLFKTESMAIQKAETAKEVAVIGGGPAGMEAALVCAKRGHNVTLYEKRELGGALIEASTPDFKEDIRRLVEYYKVQIFKSEIKVVKANADAETIKAGKFDEVILAAGAKIKNLNVPGIEKPIVTNALEILDGKVNVGRKVMIIGGGVTGAETGLHLAELGKEVSFVEMQNIFMASVGFNRTAYIQRLSSQNVKVYTGMRLCEVLDDGAVIIDNFGRSRKIDVDTIVIASGFGAQSDLRDKLEAETGMEVHAIGDCMGARMIYDAVHEGYITAQHI